MASPASRPVNIVKEFTWVCLPLRRDNGTPSAIAGVWFKTEEERIDDFTLNKEEESVMHVKKRLRRVIDRPQMAGNPALKRAEASLDMIMAENIMTAMGTLITDRYEDCKVKQPSQTRHACLMMFFEEKLELYFNQAVDSINDASLREKWLKYMDYTGVTELIHHPLFFIRYGCDSWFYTTYKSGYWLD